VLPKKLDDVSPERHFGRTVPRLALSEPVLFYACLAFASYVMVLWGKLEKSIQEQYQDKAIGLLIPSLSSPMALSRSEPLLSTTVLLRMIEQFSEIGEDEQHHLKGAYSLFTTSVHKWDPFQANNQGTTFWTYLRLTLRVCFLSEQGCQFNLGLCQNEDEAIFTPAPDEVWTNRMSYILARLCNACWAESDGILKMSKLKELGRILDQWEKGLPNSFMPWYFRQEDFEPFPTIRYLCSWHGMCTPS
jgi:hypothetical protein